MSKKHTAKYSPEVRERAVRMVMEHARQCKAAATHTFSGRSLGGNKTQERHQLPRALEATYIADLRHEDHRHKEGNAAHRLVGCNDRRH